jgi:hypothetical protein
MTSRHARLRSLAGAGSSVAKAAALVASTVLLVASVGTAGAAPFSGAPNGAAAPVAVVPAVRAAASHTVTSDTTCGGYTVHLVKPVDDSGPRVALTVTAADGTKVIDWTGSDGEWADVFWCRDVNGDGVPELGYGTFSGGHDCCTMLAVQRLGGAGGELLRLGASSPPADPSQFRPILATDETLTPMQLDGTPALELVTHDYSLRYWAGIEGWTDPYPAIYAYRDGKYVEATKDFPAYLKADRKKAVKSLKDCVDPTDASATSACQRGVGLHIEADDLMLGAATSAISRLPLSLAVRRWILAQRAKVRKLVG